MAKVLFKRYETNQEAEESPVVDGQFIVTKEGKTFVDYGEERVPIAGTLDTEMSNISKNGVQNKVIKQYVDNKFLDKNNIVILTGNMTIQEALPGYQYDTATAEIAYPQGFNLNNCMLLSAIVGYRAAPFSETSTTGILGAQCDIKFYSSNIEVDYISYLGMHQPGTTILYKIVLIKIS